jgi:hypothetical protein
MNAEMKWLTGISGADQEEVKVTIEQEYISRYEHFCTTQGRIK